MKVSEAIEQLMASTAHSYEDFDAVQILINSHEALRLAAGKVLELGLHHVEKELSRAHQEASE